MLVSIQQAAADALAAWLSSQLTGCVVKSEWAGPDPTLANRTIAITMLGKRSDEWIDPVQVSFSAPVAGLTTSVWLVANCSQVYQLDVWTTSPADRLDVDAQLEPALHRGQAAYNTATGQSYPTVPQADPFDTTLLLPLAAPWAPGTALFLFDGASIEDDPDAVKGAEYRATRRGTAWFGLTMSSVDPAMSDIKIKLRTLSWWTQKAASVPGPINGFAPPTGFQYGYGQQLDSPPNANPTFSGL